MNAGSLVILHLVQPTEKFWGVLLRLAAEGITVRGINVSSFDDWARAVARGEATLDLATMFVPLFRVGYALAALGPVAAGLLQDLLLARGERVLALAERRVV